MWFSEKSSRRVPTTDEELNDRELNPVVGAGFAEGSPAKATVKAVAAAGYENGPLQAEYEEFCQTFCHRPGCNLMRDYVAAEDDRRLSEWLDWHGHEPEARAFIRLMLAMQRAGDAIWEQTGIVLFRQGQWGSGPAPSRSSQEALSVLAQLIRQSIKEFYKFSATDAEMQVLRFEA